MLAFQYPFRPEEDYSSSWKLVYNSTRCSVPEITSLLQDWPLMFYLRLLNEHSRVDEMLLALYEVNTIGSFDFFCTWVWLTIYNMYRCLYTHGHLRGIPVKLYTSPYWFSSYPTMLHYHRLVFWGCIMFLVSIISVYMTCSLSIIIILRFLLSNHLSIIAPIFLLQIVLWLFHGHLSTNLLFGCIYRNILFCECIYVFVLLNLVFVLG